MHTLHDLIANIGHLQDLVGPVSTSTLGYKPKSRIIVPGERGLLLPSDIRGLAAAHEIPDPVYGLAKLESRVARTHLISSPAMVFSLTDPGNDILKGLGADPDGFRNEKVRSLGLGAAVTLPSGQTLYGVCRMVALENGLRMGSTKILSIDDRWTDDLLIAEEWVLEVLCESKENTQIIHEPTSVPWRRIVMLLGGALGVGSLPSDWKRQLQFVAGLRRVNLDIRPNPEAARPRIIRELKSQPPDGLLVWVDYVPNPEAYIGPYSAARPGGMAEVLGSIGREMCFDEHKTELMLHLRELAPLETASLPKEKIENWKHATVEIRRLESEYFRLSDRAVAMLESNRYPKPERMVEHVRRLAEVAVAYGTNDGRLSVGLKEFAQSLHKIEIALFDKSLSAPRVFVDGKEIFTLSGTSLKAEPHVKVDDHKSPDKCGRIYFAIDGDRNRFVVDHIGLHNYG